ncbi:hypothetical protein L6R50_26830 [Myxococcota bacterium]|nr:hypothetical protein [Myxococcota bacterium]
MMDDPKRSVPPTRPDRRTGAARPDDVLNLAVCSLGAALAWAIQAYKASDLASRVGFGALAAALVASLVVLARPNRWTDALARSSLTVSVALAAHRGLALGWNGIRVTLVLWGLWCLWVLTRASVPAGEHRRRASSLRAFVLTGWAVDLGVVALLALPVRRSGLGMGFQVPLLFAEIVTYVLWLRPLLFRRLAPALSRSPADLEGAGAVAFQGARAARARGDLDAAEAALSALPDHPAVLLLRDLCVMDRAREGHGLARVVLDGEWTPRPEELEALAAEAADLSRVDGLLQARERLLRGLISDLEGGGVFALEAEHLIEKLTGVLVDFDPSGSLSGSWRGVRVSPHLVCSRTWLAGRLRALGADRAAGALVRQFTGAGAPGDHAPP